jgi:hypothetical protein
MNASNEMGVIVEFAEHCKEAGWEIIGIQAAFPDVTIRNLEDGGIIRAEFEYNSSSFYLHRHDPTNCDLIICWNHDWEDCPMPIWALSNPGWAAVAFVPEMAKRIGELLGLSWIICVGVKEFPSLKH